ncbi:MAG: glycosyltransferase family 4 protein [Planctomycetes bacterium]|nr:glycosyltransferase family 4 protein [Planctomycetota bacterium]
MQHNTEIMNAAPAEARSLRRRICMLAPSHPSWDPRVAQRESASLAKLGHTVALVAMHEDGRPGVAGVEVLALPKTPMTRWLRIKTMWRVYQMARRWKADVYHAHEVESLAVGVLLKWRTGAKLIFDAHECFHFTAARFVSGWYAKLVTAATSNMLRFLSRRAAHVIVVSFTNEEFYRDSCGCERVTIIHNSPPPDKFQHVGKPAEATRTITHDGYLDHSRGQDQILEALALVKRQMPVKLLVVGQVAESSRADFERQVAKLGLSDEVEVTGWLEYEKAGAELTRGSIGLVAMQPTPNNYGSLSNKLFNYMCTGQAVIGPKGSDTEIVLKRADCGLAVDMTDPRELAEAMLALLRDPERTRQLGLNGRRAVETEFGWHLMEKSLEGIYDGFDDRRSE